jgi:hypothetical protein
MTLALLETEPRSRRISGYEDLAELKETLEEPSSDDD